MKIERNSMRAAAAAIFIVAQLASSVLSLKLKNVTYDGRSLYLNGDRQLFFSGSIHYPRSTPEMWPEIIRKAKKGGLNMVQTYVFWNLHEPERGQFNFEGSRDIVKFIKLIGDQGMYVTLRVGPFIQAEWNHGGFPYWLREVPDIVFRTDNPPFKYHMKRYTKMIINRMKGANLFAPQGGPIVLAQIENEYDTIQRAFEERGTTYVQWAGSMAVGLNTGVPWIMCKAKNAPGPVINTCNGRHCGDLFSGPNSPDKPTLWTENWTAQYRAFGDPPSQRSAEDLAFSVTRFFSKNGTLTNYYMYHGGTNFGRTSSHFITTRYYDEAPMDEYGLPRDPKYGHLRDLHAALRLCKNPIFRGTPASQILGHNLEARIFEKPGTNVCAAFLANNNSRSAAVVNFRGRHYPLPPHSISILPDCKTVVFNTHSIVSQHNARTYVPSQRANTNLKWEMSVEPVPSTKEVPVNAKAPLELFTLNKDVSDYAWYTTSFELYVRDLPMRKDIKPVLEVGSLGHAMLAFVNGEYAGMAHGSKVEKSFDLRKAVNLRAGMNDIALLAMTVGLPDSGVYLEKRYAGPRVIRILGLNTGTLDLTLNGWGHQVGLAGEKLKVFTQGGSHRVQWTSANSSTPIAWYKTYFDAPEGDDPIALKLESMGKGMVWINGKSIGRYWLSFLSALGEATQKDYHVPRSYLKPSDNLMVVMEEKGGDPGGIVINTVDRDTICSIVSEKDPPSVGTWERKDNALRATEEPASKARLNCPDGKKIVAVEFASFGNADGACGHFLPGNCTSPSTRRVVEEYCLGKNSCQVPTSPRTFDKGLDSCPGKEKTLSIQVKCGRS